MDIEDTCSRGANPSSTCRRLCARPCSSSSSSSATPSPAVLADVAIVGAGVVGCAVARELSKYDLRVVVFDRAGDVAQGASKANSGIVHGGYDAKHGTLKGRVAHAGNQMMKQLDRELHFGVNPVGSLTLGFSDEDRRTLERLRENGRKNGVTGLVILDGEQTRELEPRVSADVTCALLCTHTAITSPYEYCVALAENAAENGVHFWLSHEVTAIDRLTDDEGGGGPHRFEITTDDGSRVRARVVVNAAGLHADRVAAHVGASSFDIVPYCGEYILLNKSEARLAGRVLFQCPNERGKGVLVSRTLHGNLLVGPTSRGPDDPPKTKRQVLEELVAKARRSVPTLDPSRAITSYTGLRAKTRGKDFIVEESKAAPGFVNAAGIDSPGLTSSPVIADMVVQIVGTRVRLVRSPTFSPFRTPIIRPKPDDFPGRIDDPDPRRNIVCRCERVTEAEIVDAIHRPLGGRSVNGVKIRTRAGMGPCQGAFCEPRVVKIIGRELGMPSDQVQLRGKGSSVLPHRRVSVDDRKMLSKL